MSSLVWLRDDLRVADNPALSAAIAAGQPLSVVYILDDESEGIRPLGGASRWWLHHSLDRLGARLERLGVSLTLRRGPAHDVMRDLLRETGATRLYWNRRYGGPERRLDASIKEYARASGIEAQSFHANLLVEPWTIRTGAGNPYTVFTPFWKAVLARPEPPREPLPAPTRLMGAGSLRGDLLADWGLLPTTPDWSTGLAARWTPGESGANVAFSTFLERRLSRYAHDRDLPATHATSELSPHLRFGEISPFQIWAGVEVAKQGAAPGLAENAAKFLAEVGWREFSYNLLYHWPDIATRNFDRRFDGFPWREPNREVLSAWQEGRTGVPLVDAGMRELWQTGYMHNRVRMVAASFLIKNLLIDWRVGEQWFWDTLVDADPANNPASWQWVAGSGADAAPYFRVFNPVLQAEKFDPNRAYLRRYLGDFDGAGALDYPPPMVDLSTARTDALRAFESVSNLPRDIAPPSEAVD